MSLSEKPVTTATQVIAELEAERRRNLELAEQLREAQDARAEAATLLARVTNERARLRRRADLAERDAAAARRETSAAISERDAVLASTIWRATYPVRLLGAHLPYGLRRAIRGGAKLIGWTVSFRLVRELRLRRTEVPGRPFDLPPPVLGPPVDPSGRHEPIDIVLRVHDALADVRACIDAIIRFTLPPYNVILVDDGSGDETAAFLRRVAIEQGFKLLRFDEAKGFAFAANAGIGASDAAWVVLLQSDAVVSPDWLDRMWAYAVADARIGIVGPVSNAASWQSIGTDTSESPKDGPAIEDMARLVANSGRGALRIPFLDAFCTMIRRAVTDKVGLFDSVAFGPGDGAADDFSIRARQAGWDLAVVSDVYVHRKAQPDATDRVATLARKHDAQRQVRPQIAYCNENLPMHALRARVRARLLAEHLSREGRRRFEGLRIAIVLPVNLTQASQVVLHEARALERMGVNVTLLNLASSQSSEPFDLPTEVFDSPQLLSLYLCDLGNLYDAVVATAYGPVHWMPQGLHRKTRCVHYVLDYEPASLSDEDPEHLLAVRSYDLHDGMRLVTNNCWNQRQVRQQTGKVASVLGPSVGIDPFGPADGRMPGHPLAALSIVARLTPSANPRAAQRTIDVLEQVMAEAGFPISIQVLGASDAELSRAGLNRPWLLNFGELSHGGLARLLSYADIFVDLSDYQPIGLTALEAMLSGAAAVIPKVGAASDFVRSGVNGILVDTKDRQACLQQIMLLVRDAALRARLQVAAITDAHDFVPERPALRLLELVVANA